MKRKSYMAETEPLGSHEAYTSWTVYPLTKQSYSDGSTAYFVRKKKICIEVRGRLRT